jgi:hypothetical protein
MLGMAVIGSEHIALARNFSNSGNYLVNDQNCTAGNSCNLSSSNTVTSGSSGLTSPPPSTAPTPTTLTVSAMFLIPNDPNSPIELQGTLRTDTGPVAGATITFTAAALDGNTIPITTETPAETDNDGNYQTEVASPPSAQLVGATVTAHYTGISISLAASSGSGMCCIPAVSP